MPTHADSPTAGNELTVARAERDVAVARVREVETELGELRGRVKRLELMMWRRTARRQLWQARAQRLIGMVRRS
jgi:hypothetical protein